jgi:small subunit ribosomal protein S16
MLKIRLQRIGKRGQAYFRVVVLEHTTRPKGKYLELLGSYDPHKNEIKVKGEKVKYWISKGAHMSPTVNNLLVDRKIIEGEKVQVWKAKKSRRSEEVGIPTASVGEKIIETPAQPA